ncbi:MAG TPA: MFS transporter [Lacipirellulaceae bacterium]|jgi:Na+/melibiose symporter-like transporter
MSAESQKLSLTEKIGYCLGDLATNFVFQMQIMFLPYFYPEVFGISTLAMGWLFFITRLWHAVIDPMMGALTDRTNSRWGRFRPWVLWSAVPFAVLFVLTYTTPHLEANGRLIWAYTTYILLVLVYTVNNIPYSAMSGVLTGDSAERTSLASWRFVAAMTATFIVQTFTPVLVRRLGGGNQELGYQLTVGLYAVVMVVCFAATFLTTKERVQPDPNQSTSFVGDLKDLIAIGPWWALFMLALFEFINLALRGATTLYYFNYFVDGTRFVSWFNNWESRTLGREVFSIETSHVLSLFNGLGIATTLIGVITSTWLAARFGKRNVFLVCLFLSACFIGAFVFIPSDAVAWILACQILYNLSYGPTIPLLWAMMADVADYSEWRTGRRATGMVFATMMFALNTGQAIGAGLNGWLLRWYGFAEKQPEQSARAVRGIVWMFSVYPAIAFFIGCAALWLYRIDRPMEIDLDRELTLRRQNFQTN